MIDKFVTHLKNIIFFKTVIYIILIITLFTLIPILTEDLEKESFKRQKSQTFLQTAQIKLESIVHFENKISAINKKYQQLIKSSFSSGCFNRITLIKHIESLSQKYHLFEPIDCKIFRIFKNDSLSKTNGNIKVHYYELDIKFKAPDYYTILAICKEIYQFLPKGAVVTNTTMYSVDAITPKIVKKLNLWQKPELLDIKMKVQLRDIAYAK